MKQTKRTTKQISPRTWLKALKSGEYKRRRGKLRSSVVANNRFCCLGVYLDKLDHPDTDWRFADLHNMRPEWMSKKSETNLINMNDNFVTVDGGGIEIDPEDPDYVRNETWEGTGVLEYIERYLVPAYDRHQAKKKAKKTVARSPYSR